VNKGVALVLVVKFHEAAKTLGVIISNIWNDYNSFMEILAQEKFLGP
jgi:hypothetical protein